MILNSKDLLNNKAGLNQGAYISGGETRIGALIDV
jgi:hypothetical protein